MRLLFIIKSFVFVLVYIFQLLNCGNELMFSCSFVRGVLLLWAMACQLYYQNGNDLEESFLVYIAVNIFTFQSIKHAF